MSENASKDPLCLLSSYEKDKRNASAQVRHKTFYKLHNRVPALTFSQY